MVWELKLMKKSLKQSPDSLNFQNEEKGLRKISFYYSYGARTTTKKVLINHKGRN